MNTVKSVVIVKRDGALEPFSRVKLRRVLGSAMQDCGVEPKLAEPLVQALEVHLQNWDEPHPPSTDYVHRCLQAVLRKTQLEQVAVRIESRRRWRRLRRRSVRLGRVDLRRVAKPWRKSSLAQMIERRYHLRRESARLLAADIEFRVLNLGINLIAQPLLEELVRSELRSWGLLTDENNDPCGALRSGHRRRSAGRLNRNPDDADRDPNRARE